MSLPPTRTVDTPAHRSRLRRLRVASRRLLPSIGHASCTHCRLAAAVFPVLSCACHRSARH
eukprot:9008085-Alexandrium_andersonii.AAC.1